MLNIEKYKEEIVCSFFKKPGPCEGGMSYGDIVYDILSEIYIKYTNERNYSFESIINWLVSEYKEPILDDVEKEYLGNIIKPFRDNVIDILKEDLDDYECITIYFKEEDGDKSIMSFPIFKKRHNV